MGDTRDYVDSILAYAGGHSDSFWDFGHILWRPLGWSVFRVLHPLTSLQCGPDPRCGVTLVLIGISWVAGLLTVLLAYALAHRACKHEGAAVVTSVALMFSWGFLNFVHTGLSYVPGLALASLGLLLAMGEGNSHGHAAEWLAGGALAGAVGLWFLYVLAVPAVVLTPILLLGNDRPRRRAALRIACAFASITALTYALVAANLKISSLLDLRHWMASSSHGVGLTLGKLGLARMVFGLPRSWINMGNDGVLFKRFLLHDPFNPVSATDLFRLSLWKVGLFYAFLATLLWSLLASPERKRVLPLFAVNSIPVIGFALLWKGGDMERYLPLYPGFLLTLACMVCLACEVRRRLWLIAIALFVGVTVLNSVPMARHTLNQKDADTITRLKELQPLLKPSSVLVVVDEQDELASFSRDALFHPLNQDKKLHVYYLVALGAPQILSWRERFASMALSIWGADGDVWISKRVFNARPKDDWKWAEGDDPRISWVDLYTFFSTLQTNVSTGGADGFNLLLPSRDNAETLKSLVSPQQAAPRSETAPRRSVL